jgi:integrase
VDLEEALLIIPADDYKSNHVHVVPLMPQAVELIKTMPVPKTGSYLFSSTGGNTHIQGISKFYRTRLADAILSITGRQFTKRLTTQVNRRTVASRLAEELGHEGDKLVERVLGHSDGKVTRIYNRYGYVREMRRALEKWANDLT